MSNRLDKSERVEGQDLRLIQSLVREVCVEQSGARGVAALLLFDQDAFNRVLLDHSVLNNADFPIPRASSFLLARAVLQSSAFLR